MATERDIAYLRDRLLKERREIFDRRQRLDSDWRALGDRSIEMEEEAQKTDLSTLFDRLDERGKEEIEEIDLALCRLAVGTYGTCESCEKLMSLERLDALPAARLCRRCAQKYEEKHKKLPRAAEVTPCTETPDEYRGLGDEEMQSLIVESIREDGRIDMDELQVSCRKGMVYLQGVIPSETEHQILLQILNDGMGMSSIIDLLQVTEVVWEREDRTPGRTAPTLTAEQGLIYDTEEFTEDVFESQEDERPFTPPDKPPPEKS